MSSEFIETRCARAKKKVSENFVAVEYIAYKKKVRVPRSEDASGKDSKTREPSENHEEEIDPRKKQELEMKRARHDVIKFGMSGLGTMAAKKAKMERAIALGARPPKNRRSNYKKMKEHRKTMKERAIKKERASGADNILVKRKVRRKPRQKDGGILGAYGKVQKTSSASRKLN